MAELRQVPGVYFEPRPREPEAPFVRTDVAGFVGLEPRIINGSHPSRLIRNGTSSGHAFQIDISGFYVQLGGTRIRVPEVRNLSLSADPTSTPINDRESIAYSLVAARTPSATIRLVVLDGAVSTSGRERSLSDEVIRSRVRLVDDGSSPSALIGGPPPAGHQFNIDVKGGYLDLGGAIRPLAGRRNLALSSSWESIPIQMGESIVYGVAAVDMPDRVHVITVAGLPGRSSTERAPSSDEMRAEVRRKLGHGAWIRLADVTVARTNEGVRLNVAEQPWVRLADIHIARVGTAVRLTVTPKFPVARLDDWKDYVANFGVPHTDGLFLAASVRAFFANGGRRCYVTTVRRPDLADTRGLEAACNEMIGQKGDNERQATGLERLLLVPEVSFVDTPDLYAGRRGDGLQEFDLPGSARAACFRDCDEITPPGSFTARRIGRDIEPLFSDGQIWDAQSRMLRRCIDERWRVFLLLNAPMEYDPGQGRYRGPNRERVVAWRGKIAALGEAPEKMSGGALYFPWLLSQEGIDEPVIEMPPTPFVMGVMARRDLARGPHISPANETVRGVVGLSQPIDDELHGELYEPPSNINILRAFAGYGIQVWGARTLSSEKWLRYVAVRRCLSAIERRAVAALQPLVFEPHTTMLRLQITQMLLAILLQVFESGALRGNRPDQAFYIRCDASVNPPEQVENGVLLCEVGVAIAAPAEFVVFRLGRREGVVEVME